MITLYVDTASTAGGDGTSELLTGSTRAFASMREALVAQSNLTDVTKIVCKASTGAADTLNCVQAHMDFQTTETNYLWVYVDPAHRHDGKYNASKYRLEVTNSDAMYNNNLSHVRMEGCQHQVTTSTGAEFRCFRLCTANNVTANIDHRYIDCIANIVLAGGTNGTYGFHDSDPVTFTGTCRRINCVAYGGRTGFTSDGSSWADTGLINYNCTSYGGRDCFENNQLCYNCIGASPTEFDAFLAVTAGGSNNASTDDSAPGTSSRISQTFSFVDAAGRDLHLLGTDAGAKGFGLTDPASGLFSTDIDGQTRTVPWDIGADQFVAIPTMGYIPRRIVTRPAAFRPGLAR